MARELSTPLTQEDLSWLRERYSLAYVQRMVDLNGAADAPETAESDAGAESQGEGENQAETGEEDLIGGLFDPKDHTEGEVREHLAEFPEDRERVLALERGGRQRKGVLAL